jgi:DNA polymerase I-like protein with 3'-5' exonuclease and polymerase domains
MPWITFTGESKDFSDFTALQVYNALDCALTAQIKQKLEQQFNSNTRAVYKRSLRIQALCLAMMYEALPVEKARLTVTIFKLKKTLVRLESIWTRYCAAGGIETLNPMSPDQLKYLFYDVLKIPPVRKFDRKLGVTKTTVDRKALEDKISLYPAAQPFVAAALAIRETHKMLSVFKRGLEPNGKLRCSVNPAGTETGRLSSSANVFNRGTNAQNITDRLRTVVAVRPPWKLAVFDLEQAESRAVGYLSGDEAYIAACETGDLHTTVTRMVWPSLSWTNDPAKDKAVAETLFYRHFSYRDMAKRGGHGSNYYGQPFTMAKHLKVETSLMADFQIGYFKAFPGIRNWQMHTIALCMRDRKLITPTLRERTFWQRPTDPATHREAIAYVPQSLVGDVMNEGLLSVASWLKTGRLRCKLLMQIHDAGLFVYHEDDEPWLIPELNKRLIYPIEVTDIQGVSRLLQIPVEGKVGWNWQKLDDKTNPFGLAKIKQKDTRVWREEYGAEQLLDYLI